jgi:ribonucleoside-triphosphate reductase
VPNLVIKQIRKRDDRIEDFNLSKVTSAIFKAAYSVGGTNLEQARELALLVQEKINSSFKEGEIPSVEQVQDIIESVLIKAGKDSTAKAYILFRNERNRAREKRTDLMLTVKDLVFKDSGDLDLKRENGNIDGNSTMGTMLRCGGETSKIFHKSFLMSYEYALAHDRGDIHIHDLDFGSLCLNCCQIDASKLLHYGFDNGSGFIRPPSNIRSAASLICIIIQSNQNDMFGGQSIPKFDYNLAPFVAKTFIKKLIDVCSIKYEDSFTNVQINDIKSVCKKHYDKHHTLINTNTWVLEKNNVFGDVLSVITDYKYKEFDIVDAEDHKTINSIFSMALKRTEDEVYQAMEAVVHNLNTMHSRAGAQVPFSSINYGTDTSAEGRMVIKNILLALDAGMGNGETPIFPIHIFKVKDGINGNPGDPNYDLYELSVEVSAKRLFPNWVFIDAPFNLKYYKPGDPDTEAATMGCRTRVVGNIHDPSKEIFTGRGNLSFTSINLPRLAIENKGNIDAFFVALKNRVNLVFGQLLERFEYQAMRKVLNFPFLMGEGIWMDSEKLDYNDSIKEVMKHGTLGVGFIGLAECLVALIGKHHGESKEAQELGLKIVRTMREMCDEQSKETKLNFSLIGSPAEGLSGRFLRIDRKLYGVIPGVTDREYYTNSNHIPVYYPISVVNKIKLEAPYHEYENGGHITYVEVDGDPTNNVSAMMDIVQYMKKSGVGYGSINHPVDRDPVCGYTGVINDVCPRCGRRDGEAVSIEVLKKVSKYASRNLPSDEELSEKLDTVPNADISSLGKWW